MDGGVGVDLGEEGGGESGGHCRLDFGNATVDKGGFTLVLM